MLAHYNHCTVPELPEVETVVRGLRATLVGRTIVEVEVYWARSIVALTPGIFVRRIKGQKVIDVGRRGKWVTIALAGGSTCLVHLRMTGRLLFKPDGCPDDRYARVVFHLDTGGCLRFSDMRKFGRLWLVDNPAVALDDLGPEPLGDDFKAEGLAEMLAGRRARIKPLLLEQRFLAGLGNIYVDEALWRAGLHPLRRASSLEPEEVKRLHSVVQAVLQEAIAKQGTTLDDRGYVGADGQAGTYGPLLAVYGRAGHPCLRCGEPIERARISQRGTHFCPRCQPLPERES